MSKTVITQELKNVVANNPHVKEIHIDKNGNHHFNVFLLLEKEGGKKKLYASGLYLKHQVIAGHNPEQVKEIVSKGNPDTEIVETLTAEEILAAEVKPTGNNLVAQIANLSEEDKNALIALLASKTPDVIAQTPPPPPPPPPASKVK